ncbi:pilus assembly protein TadG-related protein [Geodermatophilus sp. SYSU D00815]
MQRLTARRLREERGAAAVVLALLMVPVLGFTALAVDVGAVYAERARLQVAADAAALAVAQDCARGACGDMLATATALVAANNAGSTARPPVLATAPTRVTVTGDEPVEHWFAPVIGIDETAVSASATVAWGTPGGGVAELPLVFSWCEFAAQTGGGLPSGTTERTILFPKKSDTGCTGPSRMFVPGGFGWLATTGNGSCQARSAVGGRSTSSTGNNPSNGCEPADFSALRGDVVLLPIFDVAGDEGSHAWYRVYGYAAFRITGYFFGGQYEWNKPCGGSERCVSGYFVRWVDLSDRFTYTDDGPDLGAAILRLVR